MLNLPNCNHLGVAKILIKLYATPLLKSPNHFATIKNQANIYYLESNVHSVFEEKKKGPRSMKYYKSLHNFSMYVIIMK